ncbi:MAG: response regulator [Myxococcota bacterium]|nr:response regulator [Myxococcota bacterium]
MSVTSSPRPIRVLVVDDEPNHRRCLALGLRLEGFIIVEAADASGALAELAVASYDVAVIDVMMPGVNGLELARRVRADFPNVRILLTSAYHLTEHQIGRANLGVAGFVPKPYRLDDLSQLLRSIVGSRPPAEDRPTA